MSNKRTILLLAAFLIFAIMAAVLPDPDAKQRAADSVHTINQIELGSALKRFDLEAADSRATVGVEAEPYELVEVGTFKVTFYCPCLKCCGKTDGITATGTQATEGVTVGADWSVFSAGTEIFIEGIGWRIVEDKGGAIKGHILDVFVNNHEVALDNGVQHHKVFVKEETP